MNVAVITDGYIDWNGGLDFLKIILRGIEANKDNKLFLFFISENERKFRHIPIWVKKLIESILPYKENSSISSFSDNKDAEIVNYRMNNLAKIIKEKNIDVIFPSMIDLGKEMPVKWCLELFDCQHKYYPQYFSLIRRKYRDFFYKRAMSHADMIIVNSHVAKNDFSSFYNIDPSNIYTLPLCPTLRNELLGEDDPNIVEKYNIKSNFFIISNQFWIHKAHDTAFKALVKLRERGYTDISIVCTGNMSDYRGNSHIVYLKNLIKDLNIEGNVLFLGLIPKKDQIELMKASLGVVQPSQYEGDCSGQIIDAITIGQRAICSDIPPLKEVADIENIVFFSLDNVNELADRMEAYIKTSYYRPSYDDLVKQEKQYLNRFTDSINHIIRKMI